MRNSQCRLLIIKLEEVRTDSLPVFVKNGLRYEVEISQEIRKWMFDEYR